MHSPHNRPVFLNLLQIRLPVSAVMSILHRLTGVLMVLLIPFSAFILELSLSGADGFNAVADWLASPAVSPGLFVLCWVLVHHLLAGIRYLLLDVEIGIERPAYRYTAWLVTLVSPLLALLLVWGLS
jgi:succinate dehydrogenase / fumarate reductase cytochrome b subunit